MNTQKRERKLIHLITAKLQSQSRARKETNKSNVGNQFYLIDYSDPDNTVESKN
jgi:hypothetical protein